MICFFILGFIIYSILLFLYAFRLGCYFVVDGVEKHLKKEENFNKHVAKSKENNL